MASLRASSSARMVEALLQSITDDPVRVYKNYYTISRMGDPDEVLILICLHVSKFRTSACCSSSLTPSLAVVAFTFLAAALGPPTGCQDAVLNVDQFLTERDPE